MMGNNYGRLSGVISGYSSRFLLSHSGKNIALISAKRIQAISPPSDEINEIGRTGGSWVELRNDDNKILYKRILHNFFDESVEIMTDRSGEALSWQEAEGIKKIISIMVPEMQGADHIAIMSQDLAGKDEKAVEIERFSVRF
jgi:hypothetical protein